MATMLKKRVVRKCDRTVLNGRNLIVMLEPGGTIAMRLAGKRTVYRGTLEGVYWMLAKRYAAEMVAQRKAERKRKRELRVQGLA